MAIYYYSILYKWTFFQNYQKWWKCKEGHPSYRAKLASRSNRTGCPYLPGIPCHGSRI
ncbi:zinc-ribbon domain-containing protein [Peribacillus butanolivorans]|uniref:zinc-ribbon domain-containing protein n=1 Tax=Peribacillus butanolivorans TaxID=421767 RepID=UPI00399CE14B